MKIPIPVLLSFLISFSASPVPKRYAMYDDLVKLHTGLVLPRGYVESVIEDIQSLMRQCFINSYYDTDGNLQRCQSTSGRVALNTLGMRLSGSEFCLLHSIGLVNGTPSHPVIDEEKYHIWRACFEQGRVVHTPYEPINREAISACPCCLLQ